MDSLNKTLDPFTLRSMEIKKNSFQTNFGEQKQARLDIPGQ